MFNFLKRNRRVELNDFRLIFDRFQQILAGNNVILDLISQLEDKLSGEYIFDINYLKQTTNGLFEEIERIVSNLNLIADNKYNALYTRQELIRTELENILNGKIGSEEDRFVIPYDEIDADLTEIVGGKNANLGEVRNHLKLPTPDGFVITTYAYYRFLEYNSLVPQIRKVYEIYENGKKGTAKRYNKAIDDIFKNAKIPPDLLKAISKELNKFIKRRRIKSGLAIRSSAYGEDEAGRSFAGQFDTFLNCRRESVLRRYTQVLASRFKYRAAVYSKTMMDSEMELPMAVAVQEMIKSKSSGIVHTMDPSGECLECLAISSNFGLGINIVSGKVDADCFKVSKLGPTNIKGKRICKKELKTVAYLDEGVEDVPLEDKLRDKPSLEDTEVIKLAQISLLLERYFNKPLDIEWCTDDKGEIYILQCRPVKPPEKPSAHLSNLRDVLAKKEIIMNGKGHIAQRGIAIGKVYKVEEGDDPEDFPVGAIAVAKHTSPRLTSIIRRASGILTDVGSSTGHMATVAREFGVPMIVDMHNATEILKDGMEITVDAEENVVYRGIVKELVEYDIEAGDVFRDLKEYGILRQLLRRISPLYLIDPKSPDFRAENCRTYHDLIRFCHEKAVYELINLNISSRRFKGIRAKNLDIALPLGLSIIDIGGGLSRDIKQDKITSVEDINSLPMRAIMNGLTSPGVWSTEPMHLGFGDFISSLTRYSMTDRAAEYQGQNLAVISDKYVNLSLRLGYHFNVIDSYVSESINDNYIYFRFVGGVTETERRHLRALLLSKILENLHFKVDVSGDLVVGRLKKRELSDILDILKYLGKLIGFSRQLDTQMQNMDSVQRYFDLFFSDNNNDTSK